MDNQTYNNDSNQSEIVVGKVIGECQGGARAAPLTTRYQNVNDKNLAKCGFEGMRS